MTVGQSLAAVALWDSRRFDTHSIAELLKVAEADVERVLHIRRETMRWRDGLVRS